MGIEKSGRDALYETRWNVAEPFWNIERCIKYINSKRLSKLKLEN